MPFAAPALGIRGLRCLHPRGGFRFITHLRPAHPSAQDLALSVTVDAYCQDAYGCDGESRPSATAYAPEAGFAPSA